MRRDLGKVQGFLDIAGQGDCWTSKRLVSIDIIGWAKKCKLTTCAGQQFVQYNVDRVERIECFRFRARCDSLIVIALAEPPKSNLIEIMQANGPGNGIDQDGIRHRQGNNVGKVEIEEVCTAQDWLIGDVSNNHQH